MSAVLSHRARAWATGLLDEWPLLLGFSALAAPTMLSLARREWSTAYGGHEPIVLLVTAWLFHRQWPSVGDPPVGLGHWAPTAGLLLVGLPTYILGRIFDFATFEVGGLYVAGVAMLFGRLGFKAVRALWFPVMFAAFAVPPPHALLDSLTSPLKEFVSQLVTSGLGVLGLPVARQGVIIFVAQYQLLVEDACSGMNSLMGLSALSLLYGFVTRGPSVIASIWIGCLAVPLAIAANVIRVAVLVIVTYRYGDAAAQGFIHFWAGIVLFVIALGLIFAADAIGERALKHWIARPG